MGDGGAPKTGLHFPGVFVLLYAQMEDGTRHSPHSQNTRMHRSAKYTSSAKRVHNVQELLRMKCSTTLDFREQEESSTAKITAEQL